MDNRTTETSTTMWSETISNNIDKLCKLQTVYKVYEEFEYTKGVIIIRISKKKKQYNDQKKRYKRTNNNLQNIHIQLHSSFPTPSKHCIIQVLFYVMH